MLTSRPLLAGSLLVATGCIHAQRAYPFDKERDCLGREQLVMLSTEEPSRMRCVAPNGRDHELWISAEGPAQKRWYSWHSVPSGPLCNAALVAWEGKRFCEQLP